MPARNVTLTTPSAAMLADFIEALKAGPFSHMALGGFGDEPVEAVAADPEAYIRRLTDERPRTVLTPSGQTFPLERHCIRWALDEARRFVGGVSLRLDRGNPLLERYCGHAGLGVRSDRRNQGYGQAIWREILVRCAEAGFDSIVASANVDNPASIHVITKAGGVVIDRGDPFGFGEAFVFRIPTSAAGA